MNKIYDFLTYLVLVFAEIIQTCISSSYQSQSLSTDRYIHITYYLRSSQQYCESNMIIFWKFDLRMLCKSYRVSPKTDCINFVFFLWKNLNSNRPKKLKKSNLLFFRHALCIFLESCGTNEKLLIIFIICF